MEDLRRVYRDFVSQFRDLDSRVNNLEAQEPLVYWRFVSITAADSPYSPERETIILADASAGNVTINLPAAANDPGRIIGAIKIDASGNSVIFDGDGAELVNGALTKSFSTQFQKLILICDGFNWYGIAGVI